MPTRSFRPAALVALPALAAFLAALAGTTIATSTPASAQQGFGNFFSYEPKQKKRAVRRRAPSAAPAASDAAETSTAAKSEAKKEAEKSGPQGPVYAIVSLPDQHITVYDSTGRIARSRVSTGRSGYRTPPGIYSVIGKSRFHRSNIYSGAPMPFMQRITWSGIALHAGVVPGYPASHGCIRLPHGFAPQMFSMTKMGARVIVASRDTEPVEFSHALLPTPKMLSAPGQQQQATAAPVHPVELASVGGAPITTAAMPDDAANAAAAKPLNPIAYARALRELAMADKAAADKTAADMLAAAQEAGAEARDAVEVLRKAEAGVAAAEGAAAAADATATEQLSEARAALAAARAREAEKTPAAFAAVATWKQAAAAAQAAADKVDEAKRRGEQVAVFISAKEGRIFIRQDWKEVWEAPVTIRDPDRPLGTHVFTAVEAAEDGSSMRWTAITIKEPAATPARRSKDEPAAPAEPAETAAGALDRIELPDGARERIAELLWLGGSVIVSDHPRSYEMGEYTDFIVLTR